MLVLIAALTASADTAKGEKLYSSNCLACHGKDGDGKGPAAAALKPPPTDFTSADYWQGKTDAQVKASIRSGKAGTAMMPFSQLSDADLDALVAYLRTRAP